AGIDYRDASGTVTFAVNGAGQTPVVKYVTISVFGDTASEDDETLSLSLSNVTGGFAVGRGTATGTILDDEGAGLRAGAGDVSVVEGNAGTRTVQLLVTLSGAPGANTVSIPYTVTGAGATWSKTAAGGGDFGGAQSGVLTFAGTAVSQNVSIPVYGDVRTE